VAGPVFRRISVTILSRAINLGEKRRGERYSEVVQRAKSYGFIQPDTGGKDVFVHISTVEKACLSSLNEGAKVSFEVTANRGKESAENLRVG
jgi:CspA family cold shock protein